MLKNTRNSYGSISKWLHWSIFILVLIMLGCGFFMEDLPESIQPMVYRAHKLTGICILSLMIFRLLWRWINPTPALLKTMPWWQKLAARGVHFLLYVALFAMPVSGWVLSTAAGRAPVLYGTNIVLAFPGVGLDDKLAHMLGNVHEFWAFVILALLAMHIAASLKHHYIDRDDILTRMMPSKNERY